MGTMISVLIFAVDAKLRRTLEQLPKREETKAPKRLRTDQRDHCRDMTHASNPANSALLAQSWEISVCEKVRGGPGRFRTCGRYQGLSAKVRQLSAFEAQRGIFTRVAPQPTSAAEQTITPRPVDTST